MGNPTLDCLPQRTPAALSGGRALRIICVLAASLLPHALGGETKNVAKSLRYPAISIENVEHDAGDVQQGERVVRTFELTNAGQAELVIQEVRACCGCMASLEGPKTVLPGARTKVKATLWTRGGRGS